MGPGRRTLRDTSRVLRCCFCLPGRSSVVKQMPLCYNTGTTLTNNRRSAVQVRSPAPKRSRPFGLLFFMEASPAGRPEAAEKTASNPEKLCRMTGLFAFSGGMPSFSMLAAISWAFLSSPCSMPWPIPYLIPSILSSSRRGRSCSFSSYSVKNKSFSSAFIIQHLKVVEKFCPELFEKIRIKRTNKMDRRLAARVREARKDPA